MISSTRLMNPSRLTAVVGDKDLVDHVVLKLNALCKNATLTFAIAVGRLIIDELYNGDLTAWRDRGVKDASFRKLTRHPSLPMSPGSLYRSVAIFEVCKRLGVHSWKHVSTSHIRLVLPYAHGDQTELLRSAEVNRWPVRRLEQEIEQLHLQRPAERKKGGRRPRSRLRRTIDAMEGLLVQADHLVDRDTVEPPSPESVRAIVPIVKRVGDACHALEHRLLQTLPGARSGPPPSKAQPGDNDQAEVALASSVS